MQRWHMQALSWGQSLQIMRELEEPHFNYLTQGETIYLSAGQIHAVLSPRSSAIYSINIANPSVFEWDNTLKGYESAIKGFVRHLAYENIGQLEQAVESLETALKMWKSIDQHKLPAERTSDTVARYEVVAFIRRQEEGLEQVRSVYARALQKATAAQPSQPSTSKGRDSKGKTSQKDVTKSKRKHMTIPHDDDEDFTPSPMPPTS